MIKKIILVYFFYVTAILSQSDFNFLTYSLKDGLSHSSAYSIAQDTFGFIWIASEDGLNRFDGYNFKVFRYSESDNNSISDLGAKKVLADRRGNIWVITFNANINKYDPTTNIFTKYKFPDYELSNKSKPKINDIIEDQEGNIIAGTTDCRFYKYNSKEDKFYPAEEINNYLSERAKNLQTMFIDSENNFWIGTWQGLIQIHHVDGVIYYNNSIKGKIVYSIIEDKNGTIWISTLDGGISFKKKSDKEFSILNIAFDKKIRTTSLISDKYNNLFIGTLDNGIFYYDQKNNTLKNYTNNYKESSSIPAGSIYSMLKDDNDGIWFAFAPGGIAYLNTKKSGFNIIYGEINKKGLPTGNLVSMTEDKNGNLFIGTEGTGLWIYNKSLSKFDYVKQIEALTKSTSITALHCDISGNIWIGTDVNDKGGGELLKYNSLNKKIEIIDKVKFKLGGIISITSDSLSNIYAGSFNEGIIRYNTITDSSYKIRYIKNSENSISSNKIFSLLTDKQGLIWIGTIDSGISVYDPYKNIARKFSLKKRDGKLLTTFSPWTFCEINDSLIWAGTWGHGALLFNKSNGKIIDEINSSNGINSNVIYGIISNNKNLWMTTGAGLYSIENSSGKITSFLQTPEISGTNFNLNSFYKSIDGQIYLGSTAKLITFYPDQISKSNYFPKTVLTNFKLLDDEYQTKSAIYKSELIELDYMQNFFTFEFASLDFSAKNAAVYYYKLEGIDRDWIYSGNKNIAVYTDISPGEYTFTVKGSNIDGIFGNTPASIKIVIHPPFWQTLPFKLLVIFIILIFIYSIYRYRLNKLLELERTRLKIARDLHDEVSATITGIVFFTDSISREIGSNRTGSLDRSLNLIEESVATIQDSISDIIWSINPDNDSWEKLFPKMRRFVSDLCDNKNIKYEITLPELIDIRPLKMEQRRNFWLIYKEIITNSIKHSECSTLNVKITIADKLITLIVLDNGKGFDANIRFEGNGLKNIKSRINNLKGRFILETKPNTGTKWTIIFPYRK